jgi:hypothetical protein
MSAFIDPEGFRSYIAAAFPVAVLDRHPIDFGTVHLRFELGYGHPNGSDERIIQATQRATRLFREMFSEDDSLILIIKDFDSSGKEICPSNPPGHLYTLIRGFGDRRASVEIVQVPDVSEDYSYRQLLVPASVRELDCYKIFQGITHREQGRLPRINEAVYFVNTDRDIVFHMYDDRGCLLYADRPDKLQRLYRERSDWLVDYHRGHFGAVFGQQDKGGGRTTV